MNIPPRRVSADQINKLQTEPVELTAAPGPGKSVRLSRDGKTATIVSLPITGWIGRAMRERRSKKEKR
jgi:hypothetical protein